MQQREHVLSVDFARGILACSVMIFHLLGSESIIVIDRIGFYAVYAFFVISGFALYCAYADAMIGREDLTKYAVRRFFRIAPLFWFAVLLQVVIVGWPADPLSAIPLNLSLLFGFANAGATSMIRGGWSIGIEMVFYILLPLLIAIPRKHLWLAALAALALQIIFVTRTLASHQTLATAWVSFTQPLSFVGYFVFGVWLAAFYGDYKGKRLLSSLLGIAAVICFIVVPESNALDLVRGPLGIVFLLATLAFSAAAAFAPEPKGRLRPVAVFFGEASYSIYLLHPLVYELLGKWRFGSGWGRIVLTVILTFVVAALVSRYIEIPMRNFGRRLAPKPKVEIAS